MPALSFKLEKEAMDVKTEYPTVVQPALAVPVEKTVKTKWVVLGVVIATVVVVAGFIGAFYFMHQTSQAALESANVRFKGQNGEDIDEKIETYDDDTILYTMTSESGHQSVVVEDFGRKLQVAKLRVDGRTVCYVSTLNRTRPLTSAISTQEHGVAEDQIQYEVSDEPISDVGVLGAKAQETCRGSPVYWITPKCDGQQADGKDGEVGGRNKRAALPAGFRCVRACCYEFCCCQIQGYRYRDSSGAIRCRVFCNKTACGSYSDKYYYRRDSSYC